MFKPFSFFISVFVLVFFTACSEPDLSGKEIKKEYYKSGELSSEFIMDDDSGQNGIRKTYGFDGKLISQVQMRNAVKDGVETWFDPEGRVIRKIPYINGRIHGVYKEFYPNQDIMVSMTYRNGEKEGEAYMYNKNGTIYKKAMFKNGKRVS